MTAEDPRIKTIREALDQLRGILRVHVIPADDALDSLAADLEAAREALRDEWDKIDWYVRCLEDVTDHRPVRGLAEAKAGYDSARAALARLSAGKETGE